MTGTDRLLRPSAAVLWLLCSNLLLSLLRDARSLPLLEAASPVAIWRVLLDALVLPALMSKGPAGFFAARARSSPCCVTFVNSLRG